MANSNDRILATLERQTIERTVLPNGLTVVFNPDHAAPVASIQFWVKTGSIHEEAFLGSGLSHYLEHMLFKGTPTRSPLDISREADAYGGSINAYTTFDRTVYYIDTLAETFEQQLALLVDIVFRSTLPSEEIARERDVILREIDMGLDDPYSVFSQAVFSTAFQTHPYRYPVIGHRELFEKVDAATLRDYYERRYVPSNTTLVVSGAIDGDRFWNEVEAVAGAVSRSATADVFIPDEQAQFSKRSHTAYAPVEIAHGGMAFRTPSLSHPDAAALDLLAALLGAGESSVLFQELRERREMVHDIDATCWNPGSSGLFWLSWESNPGKFDAIAETVKAVVGDFLENGLNDRLLDRARNQLLGRIIQGLKTTSSMASRLGAAEVVAGDLGYFKQSIANLLAVDIAHVSKVGARYLVDSGETLVALEPEISKLTTQKTHATTMGSSNSEPAIIERTLKNGLRVIYMPDARLPVVSMRVLGRGGPAWDPVGSSGVTQLMGEMLTKDAGGRSALQVAERVDEVGGSLSSSAGNNTFGLNIEMLSSHFERALDLVAQAISAPSFSELTFERERMAQIASIREHLDDVVRRGRRFAREQVFGDHPYARSSLGDIADLESMELRELKEHAARLLVSGNLCVAIAGDIDPDKQHEQVEQMFAPVAMGKSLGDIPGWSGIATTGRAGLPIDRNQSVVLRMYRDVGFDASDNDAGILLNTYLSGMSSPLFQRVREEKGMAYFVGANRLPAPNFGVMTFYAGTSEAQVAEVFGEFDAEVESLTTKCLDDRVFERLLTQIRSHHEMGMQRVESRSLQATLRQLYGLSYDDWFRFPERVKEFTPEDIRAFASETFEARPYLDVVAGRIPDGWSASLTQIHQ